MCPASAIRRMRSSEYQPSALRDGDEVLVHVGHQHAGLVPHERHGEQRLDAGAAAGDDRDGAGGRHGGDVAVAEPPHRAGSARPWARGRRSRPGPQMLRSHSGKTPRSRGQPLRLDLGLLVHELLDLAAERDALLGVVGDAELDEQVGEAHDAEPDAADALGQVGDLGQRVLVGVDHVLEEVGREVDHLAQARPSRSAPSLHEDAEVDRAEVADVVRQERLLAARVGGLVGRRGAAPDCSGWPCR